MSLLLLMIAFVLTGLIAVTNKALHEWNLDAYRDLYMLSFYLCPTVLGFISMLARREKQANSDRTLGMFMGFNGALSMLFLLLAIQYLPGIVVFPVRSLGNLVVTALFSIIVWRESLSGGQKLGIALSLVAIWLIY